MKLYLKRFSISLLFCLIFIVGFLTCNAYGQTYEGFVSSNRLGTDKYGSIYTTFNETNGSTSGTVIDIEGIGTAIKKYHCEQFLKCAENDFAEMSFIAKVTIKGGTSYLDDGYSDTDGDGIEDTHTSCSVGYFSNTINEEFPITEIDTSFLDENQNPYNNGPVIITIIVGDNSYILKTHTKYDAIDCDPELDGNHHEKYYKNAMSYGGNSEVAKGYYQMAINTDKILDYFQECAIEGIIAGSIGAGYNIATPYSDTQIPLSEVTEWTGFGRDFKNVGGIKYALSYYYSPIFGPLYVNKDPKIPTSNEEWIEYGKSKVSEFIDGYDIQLYSGFRDYALSLSEDQVNSKGEKIVKNLSIDYGAKRMNIAGSKDPQSVLSYNMQFAVPYVFQVQNMKAQLGINYLRVLDGYTFNIFNDKIYSTDNGAEISDDLSVTTMYEVMGGYLDNYLYLFSQSLDVDTGEVDSKGKKIVDTVKYGVVLVGLFDETVVDTTEKPDSTFKTSNLMLTGRKIGLDNGYSDSLPLEGENASLMFVQGKNSSLKSAYKPINSTFPVETGDLEIMNIRDTFTGALHQSYPELVEAVEEKIRPVNDEDFYNHINDKQMHSELPKYPNVVRFYIDFDEIVIEVEEKKEETDGTITVTKGYKGTGDYAFFFIRNNSYVHDESLIEWLKTDTAEALMYVDAEELLAKILGDFSDNITELTYQEWLAMQEIKSELQYNKDRWLIDVMNVVSMVLGIALIIFAVLFILAYWIDIFNTIGDFSILQYVSFGNLYAISSDDMGFYMENQHGTCKYVTFKDVLIISCVMLAFGLLFLNIEVVITFILYLYNYFMGVFGI